MSDTALQLLSLFLSPLLALVPVVVWEFGLRRRRERVQAAGAIISELIWNRDLLTDSDEIDVKTLPLALATHTRLSRGAFDSMAAALNSLPVGVAANLHLLYNQVDRFNAFASDHDAMATAIALGDFDSAAQKRHSDRMGMILEGVRMQRRLCINKIETSLHDLKPLASEEDRSLIGPPRPKMPLMDDPAV